MLALAGAVALLSGCVSPRNDLGRVSVELERRSGHAVTNAGPGEVIWPPSVSLADGLSEDEAVTLALWNNAAFQETLADLGLSRADLVQAGMVPNPTLSMLFPVGAKPFELTAKYPLEFLWQRPHRVAAARLELERTEQRLVQSGLDLIRDARVAFADLALADEQSRLAGETLELNRRLAGLSRARLQAGEASELEAGTAEIEARLAQEQISRGRQDVRIARERLRHLIGIRPEHWTTGLSATPFPASIERDVTLLVTNALAARPDLRAAQLGLEAAGKRFGLAKAEAFTLAAGINTKEVDKDFLSGPALDAAIPIFNQNQGGIAQAKAKFAKAARQYITIRDRIVLEVREAHTRMTQARESCEMWRAEILPPLQEAVRQAEKAYDAGNVAYLFVLETSRKIQDARLKELIALAELRRALAELERSVGQRLDASVHDATQTGK